LSRKEIVSAFVLFAAVASLVSLSISSIAMPTVRSETVTVTDILVVFPGYTSTITNSSAIFLKVPMTNTLTVTTELTYTGFKTTPMYAALGLDETELTLPAILVVALGLTWILLLRRKARQ
jgi:intracellular septation protein A